MKVFFVLLVFILTRILFLGNYPLFYDSPEYLRAASQDNLLTTLSLMHEVKHPIYVFFIQKSYHLLTADAWSVSLVSAIFGILTVVGFYLFAKTMWSKKIALAALLPLTFFPHTFLIQTQIMHEAVEQAFFLFSLWFLSLFFIKRKRLFLPLAVVCVSLAIINQLIVIIWLPVLVSFIFWQIKTKDIKQKIIFSGLFTFTSLAIAFGGSRFLYQDQSIIWSTGIVTSLKLFLTPLGFLRAVRNSLYILSFGYSFLVIPVIIYVFYKLLRKKDIGLVVFLGSWFGAFLITASIWHGGLYGRIGGLIAYPLTIMIAFLDKRYMYVTILVSVIASFVWTVKLYIQTPVFLIETQMIQTIGFKDDDLLVISDYQRPQISTVFPNSIAVGSATYKDVEIKIDQALGRGKRVFITKQAILFPYKQYDGQSMQIISLGDISKAHLGEFVKTKKIDEVAFDSKYPLLTVYQLRNE